MILTIQEEKKTNMSLLFSLVEEAIEEVSSEKQRKWACAQMGDSRKNFKGTPSLNPKEAEEMCKSKVEEEEELEEMSAMGAGSVEGYSGPPLKVKKKKKNNNEEIIEYVINYLLGKQKIVEN